MNPVINLTPDSMTTAYVHIWRDMFYRVYCGFDGIKLAHYSFHSLQEYRCVNIHALYSDIVKYGIITTHSHEHPQSLAEELLVRS